MELVIIYFLKDFYKFFIGYRLLLDMLLKILNNFEIRDFDDYRCKENI